MDATFWVLVLALGFLAGVFLAGVPELWRLYKPVDRIRVSRKTFTYALAILLCAALMGYGFGSLLLYSPEPHSQPTEWVTDTVQIRLR